MARPPRIEYEHAFYHITSKRLNALSKSDRGLRAKIEALKEALSNVKG